MKKKFRQIDIFNLSFLDVISCGFGAIILLLVISKISQPWLQQQNSEELVQKITLLQSQIEAERTSAAEIMGKLEDIHNRLTQQNSQRNTLQLQLGWLNTQTENLRSQITIQNIIKEKLHIANQTLSEEMRRLERNTDKKNPPIGGITVDSEYIIFVIDTSGSMQTHAWPLVRKKMQEILQVHPQVKGVQVLNDMGDYMFTQYAGRWIADTPARRRAILKRLASWAPFSNSSPEEGITRAIKTFYSADKNIALYIFGDDFSRGSIQSLLDAVAKLNHSASSVSQKAKTRVRINAIGFPVLFKEPSAGMNVARFAALMRKLAEENSGSFIGLNSLK